MSLSQFQLTDRVAIVTGAGRGIGRSIALGFANAGAHVVAVSRTAKDIDAVAAEVKNLGRRALAIPTDVRDSAQIKSMVDKTMAEFGKIDILVNDAGSSVWDGPILEMSEQAWDAMITMNLKSVFLCIRAVGPIMAQQKRGVIINISSLAGVSGNKNFPHYAAAKAGVVNLTRTISPELARHNIRVNCIAPGTIETPLVAALFKEHPDTLKVRLRATALNRLGKPEDFAGPAIFLASDASAFVTGETINVSGGMQVVALPGDP